ncbi:MAG: DNA mismatch repair protein MutS, partial [Planctomycetes bacterium]|nr:DNA mismatch repair protein MutS [Planctomycetota bacterium]
VLAQAGSYVPAQEAHIGIVDRLFTRVGAGDELARNMSTFMVEMAETAAILNNASKHSLVILDEVGRGTSTYDGVSLAWAITEHLHDNIGCRCLFATHYHELCDLESKLEGVCNLTVAIAEENDNVVFLHRIIKGAATKSYGIHVAQLAGVPQSVISRAHYMLEHLEDAKSHSPANISPDVAAMSAAVANAIPPTTKSNKNNLAQLQHQDQDHTTVHQEKSQQEKNDDASEQLNIFSVMPSPCIQELLGLNIDECTPRQALDILFSLQEQARKE